MVTIHWRLEASDPVVQQHVVKGRRVLPFASWLNRCFDAVTAVQSLVPRELSRVVIARPMVFDDGNAVEAQFVGRPESGAGRFEVREEADAGRQAPLLPFIEGGWRNATDESWLTGRDGIGAVLNHEAFYLAASKAGYSYGPQLRRIERLQVNDGAWTADLTPRGTDRDPSAGRESTWDALLQSGAVLAAAGDEACWIPSSIDRFRLSPDYDDGAVVRLCGEWIGDSQASPQRVANICGFGASGTSPRVEFRGVRYRLLDALPAERASAPVATTVPELTDVCPDNILKMIRSASPEHRQPPLVRFIEDQLLEILQWDRSRRAELAAGFAAVGVDSLSSLDLQYRLQTALEFALPLGESFNHASADELAAALLLKHITLDRN